MISLSTNIPTEPLSASAFGYAVKYYALIISLFVDAIGGAIGDLATSAVPQAVIAIVLQVVARLALAFVILLIAASTAPFRYGMMKHLCQTLAPALVIFPISSALMIGLRVWRIVMLESGKSAIVIWSEAGYQVYFYCSTLLSITMYTACLRVAFKLGTPKLYQGDLWLKG